MVAAQLDVSVGQALTRLRAYAFAHDRPLAAVADAVVGPHPPIRRPTRRDRPTALRGDQPGSPAAAGKGSGQTLAGSSPGRPMAELVVAGGPMTREALLARTFVELADSLVADFDVIELLTLWRTSMR